MSIDRKQTKIMELCMHGRLERIGRTHGGLDEFIVISPGADRDGDFSRGEASGGRSMALSEGLLTDPLGRRGVKLHEASTGHGDEF